MEQKEPEERKNPFSVIQTNRFYGINDCVLYCTSYTYSAHLPGPGTIHIEGISPEDYPAYVAHRVIGENKNPYRTVAEIESIPYPKLIALDLTSDTKIVPLSNEDAFFTMQARRERLQKIEKAAKNALEHLNWMDQVGALTREEMPMLHALREALEKAQSCICDQYTGAKGFVQWHCPQHGKCSTGFMMGVLKRHGVSDE